MTFYTGILLGVVIGYFLCAMLTAASKADQREPHPDEHEQFPEGRR